jgi:O-antigen ligase
MAMARMKDISAGDSISALHSATTPWLAFLFFAVVFYVLQHVSLMVLQDTIGASGEDIETSVREGNLHRFGAFSMIGLFGLVGLMRPGQNRLKITRAIGWLTLFYVVWASVSVGWADDVFLTFKRLVILWMLFFGALAVGKHFSLRDIVLWVFFTTAGYLLLGIAIEVILGTLQPMSPDYRFMGTLHPNHQGINCALLVLTGFAVGRTETRGRSFFFAAVLVGIAFLLFTRSRTAFAAGLAALLVYLNLVLPRTQKLIVLIASGIGLCLLGLLFGEAVFQALAKGLLLGRADADPLSFTGRLPMWMEVLDFADDRFFQGYGYASFFTPSRIAEISATQGWGIGELHSTYLELMLGLGVIGLTAFVTIVVLGIQSSIEHYKRLSHPGYAFFAAFFVFCLLHGVLETALVSHGILSFALLVLVVHLGFTVSREGDGRVGPSDAVMNAKKLA